MLAVYKGCGRATLLARVLPFRRDEQGTTSALPTAATMLFSVLVTFVAAGIAAANPLKRQLAQVITDCVNPNDAALTFVRGPLAHAGLIADTHLRPGRRSVELRVGLRY